MPDRTILVVEDEGTLREIVCDTLVDEGWYVLGAKDGEEAFRPMGEEGRIDALFTDIRLPGFYDGWTVARQFREHRPEGVVIYATGYSATHTPVSGSMFFRKPYKLQQVILCLDALKRRTQANP